MASKLSYYDGSNLMNKGDIRISASSIARYITETNKFWRELMLGESGFEGSTASVLGTATHFFGEDFVKTGTVDGVEVEDYIDSECAKDPEVDGDIIRANYPIMGSALINQYIIPNSPTFVEEFLMEQVIPATATHGAIHIGGSCDNCTVPGITYAPDVSSLDIDADQAIITDYKTTSATSLPDRIPWNYRVQALVYAYLYGKRGINVDRIRIVYVTRNNVGRVGKYNEKTKKFGVVKQYPTQVKVLTESIEQHDLDYIEGLISVVAKSIRLFQERPDLRDIITQDSRLLNCKLPNE